MQFILVNLILRYTFVSEINFLDLMDDDPADRLNFNPYMED